MKQKAEEKKSGQRDKNKRYISGWIDKELFDTVESLAKREYNGNRSMALYQALKAWAAIQVGEKST